MYYDDTANIIQETKGKGKKDDCHWWRKKSTTTQCAMCLVPMFLLLIGLVAFATLFTLEYGKLHSDACDAKNTTGNVTSNVCITPDCVTAGGQMILAMDQTVDPCDDFFKYACGGFEMRQSIPAGQNQLSEIDFITTLIQRELRGLLEVMPPPKESEARAKSRNYYMSCLNRTKINADSAMAMTKLVKDMGGLFLKQNATVSANWSLGALLASRNMYSTSAFFSVGAGTDDKNVSKNIIQINQGGLGLGAFTRDYYLNKSVTADPTLKAYAEMLATYAQLIVGKDAVDMDAIYDVVMFEQKLAEIQQSQAAMRDVNAIYNKVNVTWLQQNAGFINWMDFFNNLLEPANVTIGAAEPVLLYATPYIKALSMMVENMTMPGMGGMDTVIQNYVVLQSINDYASKLSDDFQAAYYKFQTVFAGLQGAPETWQTCVADTDATIGYPLGAMYVDAYFGKEAKQKAANVIDDIIATFRKRVQTVDWMDDGTKKQALEKLDLLTHDVAFPDWIDNSTYLNKMYSAFSVSDDYVMNIMNAYFYETYQFGQMVRSPPDPKRWEMTPPTVDAYYEPTQNRFVVPAGILNPVFFFKAMGVPDLINYAAIGTVTGHEITHGFDDQGAQYDKHGNLHNWWNNNTMQEFNKRTKCIVDQYDAYQVDGLHLRGQQTLGENIADNGGIRTSFEAYKMAQDAGKLNLPHLIGVELTPDQLFFVGYAQVQCSIYTPEAMRLQILGNPHSPDPFRVIGPLSNSPDFAKAYNCPVGSKMHPKTQCTVW